MNTVCFGNLIRFSLSKMDLTCVLDLIKEKGETNLSVCWVGKFI